MKKKKSMEERLKEALSGISEAKQDNAELISPQAKEQPQSQAEPQKEVKPAEEKPIEQPQPEVPKKEEPKREEPKRQAVNLDDREEGKTRTGNAPEFIDKPTPQEAPQKAPQKEPQKPQKPKKPQEVKKPINTEKSPKQKININPKYIFGILLALALFMYLYGILVSFKKGEIPRNCVMPHIALVNGFTNLGSYALLMILLVIAIVVAAVIMFGNRKPKTDRVFVSDILGSSSFATEEDKKALVYAGRRFEDMPSFIYGTDESTGELIGYKPDLEFVNFNTAICGPQRSGKSFMLVRNNLAQLIKMGQSVIITDPKGEMYRDMSEAFLEAGYIVKQLNTEDFYASDSWNILGAVNMDNIDSFVKTFVANISDSREQQVYSDVKNGLLKALCLYVLYEDKDLSPEDRNLSTVYEMLQHNKLSELDAKFEMLDKYSEAKSTYMIWKNADKLRQNSVTTLGMGMQFLSNKTVKQVNV